MTIHNPSHNTQCERMVLATANNGEFQFSVNSWFDQLGIWILPHTISYNFCVPWISIPVSESDYIFLVQITREFFSSEISSTERQRSSLAKFVPTNQAKWLNRHLNSDVWLLCVYYCAKRLREGKNSLFITNANFFWLSVARWFLKEIRSRII